MDVYFRSCPRDVRVTTLIFIPSLNTKMYFIMLEQGIFLEDFSFYAEQGPILSDGTLEWYESEACRNGRRAFS